jgi:hypothetical protein
MHEMRNREGKLIHATLVFQVVSLRLSYQLCESFTEAIDDGVDIAFAVRGILVCL